MKFFSKEKKSIETITEDQIDKDIQDVLSGKELCAEGKYKRKMKKAMRSFTFVVIALYLVFFGFAKLGIIDEDIFDLPAGAKFHFLNSCQLRDLDCVRNVEFLDGTYVFFIENNFNSDLSVIRIVSDNCTAQYNYSLSPGQIGEYALNCFPEREVDVFYRLKGIDLEKKVTGVVVNIWVYG